MQRHGRTVCRPGGAHLLVAGPEDREPLLLYRGGNVGPPVPGAVHVLAGSGHFPSNDGIFQSAALTEAFQAKPAQAERLAG